MRVCLAEEAAQHAASMPAVQSVKGTEPALQLLLLPFASTYQLPRYASVPEYLDPSHCRVCLQSVLSGDLERHLRDDCLGCSEQQYRRFVLRLTLAAWPQSISPQTLRSCLAAFKGEFCDAKYQQGACASCCRLKRKNKLRRVVFPAPSCDAAPDWLPWTDAEWQKHKGLWYAQIDKILNIDLYLERFFRVSERTAAAAREVMAFDAESGVTSSFSNRFAAEVWSRRVHRWSENLRRDIMQDSVASVADDSKRFRTLMVGQIGNEV